MMHWNSRNLQVRPFAFTLVELLVVVAIIIIIIAILIPALSRAMEAAQQAKCAANHKKLATGLRLYATDHKGVLMPYANRAKRPPSNPSEQPAKTYSYEWHLAPYIGEPGWGEFPVGFELGELLAEDEWVEDNFEDNTGNQSPNVPDSHVPDLDIPPLQAMQCPVVEIVDWPGHSDTDDKGSAFRNWTKYDQIQGSYSINGWLLTPDRNNLPDNNKGFYRISQTRADVPAFAGATYHNGWPQEHNVPPDNYNKPKDIHPEMWRFTLNRHRMGVMMSHTDGSAERVAIGDLWFKQWHLDWSFSKLPPQGTPAREEIDRLRD